MTIARAIAAVELDVLQCKQPRGEEASAAVPDSIVDPVAAVLLALGGQENMARVERGYEFRRVLAGRSPGTDALDTLQATLRDGLMRWFLAGGEVSLARCLRLPETPAGFRMALRDFYLAEAYWATPGATPETRLRALQKEINSILGWKYPQWARRKNPDPCASELDALLFAAACAGDGELPRTVRALRNAVNPGSRSTETRLGSDGVLPR